MEDLAAVVIIVLIPALGALEPGRFVVLARALGTPRSRSGAVLLAGRKGAAPLMSRAVRHPDAETILHTVDRVRVFGLLEQIAAFAAAPSEGKVAVPRELARCPGSDDNFPTRL